MKSSPINIFQKLMRKWDSVHPYNAAQVMRIKGNGDIAALSAAWQEALSATGLGKVIADDQQYHFESTPHSTSNVMLITAALDEHVTKDLNRPFADTDDLPFRPFIIQNADDYFAGVVYHHWIADSASIRLLMREWFVRVHDPGAAKPEKLVIPNQGYWKTIGPHRGGWEVMNSALGMARRHTRMRRTQKIDSTELSNHATAFKLFPTADGFLPRIKSWASSHQVKLNDLFLAALVEACAIHVPLQRRKNRTDIAVGSIVDLRPFCRDDLSRTFGLYLGFTNVICRPTHLQRFDRILKVVSNQTKLQKATGVAQASLMWMAAAVAIGSMSRPDELYHFYRKELPLAGGISNVDLTSGWVGKYHPGVLLDYIRVSPSGPMTPLVLTTTTLGRQFHIGVTYRVGLIGPNLAAAVVSTFLKRLEALTA